LFIASQRADAASFFTYVATPSSSDVNGFA
jgi:hypothetical protein